MESLIFVGGLQYSGKSYFARSLESSHPSKYKHIEMDELSEYLSKRREVFMELIRRYDKYLCTQIENFGRQFKINGDYNLFTLFANYMIETGRSDELGKMLQLYVLFYTSKNIEELNEGVTPIINGSFTTIFSRKVAYQALQVTFGKRKPFDELQKLFVYFNLGLDLSLERFKKTEREEIKSLRWSEDLVKKTFEEQEIPTPEEFPNLEVIVINNSYDLKKTTTNFSSSV